MASRGNWYGGARGRSRGRGLNIRACEQQTFVRNYGVGRGNPQMTAEHVKPSSKPSYTEEQAAVMPLETGMANLQIQKVQGGEVLDGVIPNLDQHTLWIHHLSRIWTEGHQMQVLSRLLVDYFQSTSDSYRTALYLTYKSPGFYTNKGNSLPMLIIKEFDKWLKKSCAVTSVPHELKESAFQIAFQQKNAELIRLILTIYQLVDEPGLFLDHIKYFVLARKYREACIGTTILKLQHFFDIKEIIVPLMLQDSLCFVEDYLAESKEQQQTFLAFVDSLCSRDAPIQPMLMEMSEVPDIKRDKCQPKIFRKLCTRLMKKFNVPPETCPNVAQGKSTGAVKFLLYKKYVEQSVDFEDWDQLVHDAVHRDVASQKELILSLVCYSDVPCAVKYAIKYALPTEELPYRVQEALRGDVCYYEPPRRRNKPVAMFPKEPVFQNDTWGQEEWEEVPEEFHQLSLPLNSIIFVDNRTKLLSLVDSLTLDCSLIGIDGEWKPSFGVNPSKLAVLQLATKNAIYVLDTIGLQVVLSEEEWLLFVKSLFCNPNILKLGFGISSDFKMMAEILPASASAAMEKRVNVLDLQTLCSQLCKSTPDIFPHNLCDGGNGLTDLTKACLGKSLNKTDQFSNWERRPLRQSQLTYAALDAYCLLEIYEVLRKRADELHVDLDTAILACTKSKPKAARAGYKQKPPVVPVPPPVYTPEPPATPCSPGDLAVVVDTMLQGLGKRLRLCGVDVKILETCDDHEEAVKVAVREKRVILTSGGPYAKLRQYVPEGKCLSVKPGPTKEQVAQVFHAFNVKMTSKDIFSRCQICNHNRYIMVPSNVMKSLWENSWREAQVIDSPPAWSSKTSAKCFIHKFDGGTIDFETLTTDTGAKLQFEGVILSLFDRVDEFYVCANCGKVYWIGSHMNRALEAFGDMFTDEVD